MKRYIILIFIILMINNLSRSQVSEYYFKQQNQSYTEITGGTVLWSGTFSDEISGAITIPSFTFNNTAYNSLYVSANGFITFGLAPTGSNVTPISSSAAYAGAISGFGRNLNQAATGSPDIRYELVGNEFVIQWKDVRREGIASEIISFQIRLNTSNDYVSVVYGGTITPGSNATYPQVGLRGTGNSDYNDRTIAAAGGNWINSTAGPVSSSTMYFNSATPGTVPTAGLTYTWKPLYNPSNLTATAVNFNEIDLAWQKNSQNSNVMLAYNTTSTFGTPVSGQVYSAGNTISGGGTVLFYGNGTAFNHTGLNPNILYYYKIWSYDAVPDYSTGMTTTSRTAYSLTYLQDFNGSSMPAEWTTDMSMTASHGTAGTKGLNKRMNSGTCYAISPLVGSITSNTYLSFHYRFVEYNEYPMVARQLGSGDKIDVQVSLDDGATFTTFFIIDQSNHTATTEFTNKVLSLSAYAADFIKVRFLTTWATGDYYVDIDNVLFEDGNNMTYSGYTVEQSNLTNVGIGTADNDIIRLQVITQKSENPLSVTSISLSTSGSTNDADIAAAKIYYTSIPVFSTATQFGITVNNPGGAFIITGSQPLAQGNNYFWVAYNIKSTATAGNVADAQCSGLVTSESGITKVPTVSVPPGSRKIGALISGTKSVPTDYATIAAAVTALNNGVIGSGGVTVNVAAGYTETGANIVLTATGSSSDPITFQKFGTGSNPLVTAAVGTSTTVDGIFKIAGGDYITFDGIDILDPVSNTTATQRMEWGYALVRKQNSYPFDGCQYVTIKNCTITLQKAYTSSTGIHAGNHIATSTISLSIMSPSDAMNNCEFYGNNISNVYAPIELSGYNAASPYSLYDQGNKIGVSGGNTITNFGGTGTACYAIYTIYENGIKVANNTINGGSGTTAALYGIYLAAATSATADIYENIITLAASGTTAALAGIYNAAGSTADGNTVNIYNNDIINCSYSTATTGTFTAISNTATPSILNIYGNTISSNTLPGTGLMTAVSAGSPVSLTIYQNTISENYKTGASGTMNLVNPGDCDVSFHDNDIFNNGFTNSSGTSSCNISAYYNENSSSLENIYNNDIYNLTVAGTNTSASSITTGIRYYSTSTSVNKNINQNNIYGLNSLAGAVYGIYQDKGTAVNIYKNDIHDLSTASVSTSSGIVTGIWVNSGAAVNIYNNLISDLRAAVNPGSDAIRGISITSTQTNSAIGVYYNSIYLNGTSGATNFGSSGIYHTDGIATTAVLDLRNNIIINNSTQKGTAYTAAFRRNSSGLANYSASSNFNIFYAGTPGTYSVIYLYGTSTTKQTIDDYRAFAGPNRDSVSFSEMPPFQNVTTAPYNLHLQDGQLSYCESGGEPIISPVVINDDYEGTTRNTPPDIGADEFSGISAYVEMPASFAASSLNSQQIKLDFLPNQNGNNVVLVYSSNKNFTDPAGAPVVGQPLAGGTVLSIGTSSPVIHSGNNPNDTVYYKAFCYNPSIARYSLGRTAKVRPTVTPVTNFCALAGSRSEIDLGWTKNSYNHDVMITSGLSYLSGNPVQNTLYSIGDSVPSAGRVIYKGPLGAYTHSSLATWSQHYYKAWSADSYNYYSTGVNANAITDADTIHDFGYIQNFDGTWGHDPQAPENWMVVDVGGSGTFTWVRYTTTGTYVSYPASARGYGNGACNDYLISPPLDLPDTALRLSWWDKVSNVSYPNSYKILLSTTNNQVSSFTTELGDYTCTNIDWARHTTDLSAFKGQTVYLAYYQYYSQSQYYSFSIDNILVETLVPGPVTLDFPFDGSQTIVHPSLKWEAPESTIPILGFKVYLGTNPSALTIVYDGTEPSFSPQALGYSTTYYWKVVPYNENGEAYDVPVWSFTTVRITQLAESFEAGYFPPVSWSNPISGWNGTTSSALEGVHSATRFTYADIRPKLITPLVSVETGDHLEFFDGTATKINNFIQVYYSEDKITWSPIGDVIEVTVASWGHGEIDLSAIAGNEYYLAFEAWCATNYNANIYIDHVIGPDIVPVLPAAATNPVPPNGDTFDPLIDTLAWFPGINGGIPAGYKIYMDTNPDPSTLVYDGLTPGHVTGILANNTTYYWKVVPYNSVGQAAGCPAWSFTTVPEGGVQIGRDYEDYLDLPIYPDYAYNYTQTIYLQPEIRMTGGSISKLYYQWNGAEQGDNYKDWVIYMGHTTKSEFTGLTDWIPVSQMTQVFDGEVFIPATEGWIEISLDVSFYYNNSDNLVIAVDENTDGYAENGFSNFYGTFSNLFRGIIFYSDNENPDPANPPAADYVVDGFANIRLQLYSSTTWTGGISPDWTNPANWTVGVPVANSEVIISPGGFDPQISNSVIIKKLILASQAEIKILPGGTLEITGN
jgi:hypothetical protein